MIVSKVNFKTNPKFNNKVPFGSLYTGHLERATLAGAKNMLGAINSKQRLDLLTSIDYTKPRLQDPKYVFLLETLKKDVRILLAGNMQPQDFIETAEVILKNLSPTCVGKQAEEVSDYYIGIVDALYARRMSFPSIIM